MRKCFLCVAMTILVLLTQFSTSFSEEVHNNAFEGIETDYSIDAIPDKYAHNFGFEDDENAVVKQVDAESNENNTKYTVANSQSSFSGFSGTGKSHMIQNAFTIENAINTGILGSEGKALRLGSAGEGSDKNQLNGIYTSLAGIVVHELDFYTDIVGESIQVVEPYVKGVFADGRIFGGASLNDGYISGTSLTYNNGVFTFNGETMDVGQTPAWHNIKYIFDLTNKIAICIIDDTLLNTRFVNELESLTQTNRMVLSIPKGAVGSVWINNLSIYSVKPPNEIVNISAEDKTTTIELVRNIPIEKISELTIMFEGEKLSIKSMEYTDENKLCVTTKQNLYTNVDISVSIKYEEDEIENILTKTFKLSPAAFDVQSITLTGDEGQFGVSAVLLNTTGQEKTATMVMSLINENGLVAGVYISNTVKVLENPTTIAIENQNTEYKKAEVFFVDNMINCVPIKNTVYRLNK